MLMSSGPLTLKDRSNSVSEQMLILSSVTPFCLFRSYEVERNLPEESHGALSSHSFGTESFLSLVVHTAGFQSGSDPETRAEDTAKEAEPCLGSPSSHAGDRRHPPSAH